LFVLFCFVAEISICTAEAEEEEEEEEDALLRALKRCSCSP
jgi:hypothetical protein